MNATAASHAVTDDVAGFVVAAKAGDIPKDVAHFGKRSVLDGIGLALAGAASECGAIARRYLEGLGIASDGGSTVIGSSTCDCPRASRPSPTAWRSTPTITTTRSSPSPRIASTACSRIPPRPRCRPCWRSRSAIAGAAPI